MSQQKIARLAAELELLREQVRVLQTTPQLPNSSIDDGAVNVYDRDGQQTMQVGKQHDGTFVAAPVAGPTPPQPSAAIVESIPGGLRVAWDGEFFMGAVAPMDFARVEVHVSATPGFDPSFATTLRGTIETPRGADVIVLSLAPNTPHYVKLVCRAQTGKGSTSSVEVEGTPRLLVASDFDPGAITGTTIWYGASDPALEPESTVTNGDLWMEEVAAGPPPQYVTYRRVSDAWVELADQTASQAVIDALAAQQAAADAELVAQGKLTVFYEDEPPAYAGDPGTAVWYDTNDGNAPYVWSAAGAVAARTNLVVNPTFGVDVAGWGSSTNASNIRRANLGDGRIAWDYLGTAGVSRARTIDPIAVTPGQRYFLNAKMRCDTGAREMTLWAQFYDSADAFLGEPIGLPKADVVSAPQGVLTEALGIVTVPAGAAIMRVGIGCASAVKNDVFVCDEILAEIVPTDGEFRGYFAGNTAGASWTGTPHASTSTMPASAQGWVRRRIGSGAIAPKSLIAKDIIATGTVTAALLEAVLVLATEVVAGNPNAEHTRMSAGGVVHYADTTGDGVPNEVTRLGRTVGAIGATGKQTWIVDEEGDASLRSLSVTKEPVFQGRSLSSHIDDVSRGLVLTGQWNMSAGVTQQQAERGVFDVGFLARRGRAYRLIVQGFDWVMGDGQVAYARIRRRWGTQSAYGTAPVATDPMVMEVQRVMASTANGEGVNGESHVWYPDMPGTTGDRHVRLLFSFAASTTGLFVAGYPTLMVEDVGPIADFVQIQNNSTDSTTTTTTPKTRYVTTFPAKWAATWHTSGAKERSGDPMTQGTGGGYSRRSAWGWDRNAVVSELTGATVEKVEFYVYAEHWYYNAGGTLRYGWHGATAEPASFTGGNAYTEYGGFPRYAGRWIDISWMNPATGASVQNGQIAGLAFEAPSSSATYYGKFSYSLNGEPSIRVTYLK